MFIDVMLVKFVMFVNDLCQCLCIVGGGILGFFVCKLMNWDYGLFFGVYLMLLFGLMLVINLYIVCQFFVNLVVISVEVLVLYGLFGDWLLLMMFIVFGFFVYCFVLMVCGLLFFFGVLSLVFFLMLLYFVSYLDVDLFDMFVSNMVVIWLMVVIVVLMFYLFFDVELWLLCQVLVKDVFSWCYEMLFGVMVVILFFVVFQIFDLKDLLLVQIVLILVLFFMYWKGVYFVGCICVFGMLFGCVLVVGLQVLFYDYYDILFFVVLLLWILVMFCVCIYMLENGVLGIGFGVLIILVIVFGQYLMLIYDMMFSVFY